ncbi:chorismate--pyruvate lyase family protein [Marinomonas pollencensis]|uniref:Probable chorismate pyruvate-lyase n=1 Tax=Marinomonas pollencensis TaxID=491954 RepID=A0A3E0DM49_9GAMM|nr:chorismate lyase [Marinomonas pollencensis]REG83920.1 chorismate lyase [Marinomonas pollencensis]
MQINHSIAQQLDYRWHPIHRVNKAKIPADLWPWLATAASLTKKLQQAGKLSVVILEDGWGRPTQRERKKLGLAPRHAARIRTVLLKFNDEIVIYGRSIIPAQSLRGHWRRVSQLKEKPLGGYLFRHRNLSRSTIEITELPASLFPGIQKRVWARRSVFQQYGPGILVNEAFFDTILDIKPPLRPL